MWVLFTLLAAAGQTARNAMQRDLVATLGTAGATHVRFLFGMPFALVFLPAMALLTGEAVPRPDAGVLAQTALGALAQIFATGLMLKAMSAKSFVVTTAYTKTEPVLVALFGLFVLGDALSPLAALAIAVATFGVVLTAWPASGGSGRGEAGPVALGLAAAGLFAIAAVAYRAGIVALPSGGFAIRASTVLALALTLQAVGLSLALGVVQPSVLRAIVGAWKPSLFAGFMGALASQFWFLGFALTSAANVRTLALVEVLFARAVSGKLFAERPKPREGAGLALIVLGVALLLNA